jgi:hypothetical protein
MGIYTPLDGTSAPFIPQLHTRYPGQQSGILSLSCLRTQAETWPLRP